MSNTNLHNESINPFAHLAELRHRLFHILLSILLVFLGLLYFANDIYEFLSAPLISQLPESTSMIATEVTSPLLTPIKLTLITAVFLCIPVILYQVWLFIAPGLYQKERKLIMPLLVATSFMFYIGVAFAYFMIFPVIFKFLTNISIDGVEIATEISSYLDFVMTLFIAFGVIFEIPVFIILMCWVGIITPQQLQKKRPYIFVLTFIIGMLLTPPDIISQSLLAIPMYLLFEMGVFIARVIYNNKHCN
ncbi:twin-arginine translocase subunit TatC [Zooshikella sp. RANM57]|uniref:twin-arginine translocase subunit TatC n=1 Tax=Zooshikella sp. RANM57 TaxID=3425863 RepID=UPI003D6F6D81